jgi:hypothetical protein
MKKVLRIPIARLGAWHHPQYGVVKFSKEDFNSIIENFKINVRGYEPPLRYGHHEKGPGIHDGERALGHMIDVYQLSDVLWGVFDPNDEQVINEIEKGQYRYATAEIIRNAIDKFSGKKLGPFLKSHALTNTPFIPNLPRNIVDSSDSLAEVLSDGGEVSYVLSELLEDLETYYSTMMTCECCNEVCETTDEKGYCSECQESEGKEDYEKTEEMQEVVEDQPSEATSLLRKLSDFMKGISQEVGSLEKEIYDTLDKKEKPDNQEESSLMQKLVQRIETVISKLDKFMLGDKAETYSDKENLPAEEASVVEAEVAPEPSADSEAETEKVEIEESEQEPDATSITEEDLQVKEELEKLQAEMELLAAEKAELETAKAKAEEDAKAARAELEAKEAEAVAAEVARKEQEFALMLSDRVNDLVAKGVAPVKANKAADLVRGLKASVTTVSLSEGSKPVSLVDAVFELLSDVQDVSYEQDGVAGLPGDSVEENPYKAQIERLRAKRAGQ